MEDVIERLGIIDFRNGAFNVGISYTNRSRVGMNGDFQGKIRVGLGVDGGFGEKGVGNLT